MVKKASNTEKEFQAPHSPLIVKLVVSYDHPAFLEVIICGPKRNEHKEPKNANFINNLFYELKTDITASGLFPPQGRLTVDPYPDEEACLSVRYPPGPPQHHASSLIDKWIRNPRRQKNNKKNSKKLFLLLAEKMPLFIRAALENASNRYGTPVNKEISDAYDILGATPHTPWEKIKSIYRDKVRESHPDAKGGVDDGTFHKVQNAYELLKKLHHKNRK